LEPIGQPVEMPTQGVRLVFLASGPDPAARIELIEPTEEGTGVARFLESRGEGLHHLPAQRGSSARHRRAGGRRGGADRPRAAARRRWPGGLHPPAHPQRSAVGADLRTGGAFVTSEPTPPIPERPLLRGDRVWLRPLEERDLPAYVAGMNDAEVGGMAGYKWPLSVAQATAWLQRTQEQSRSGELGF